jgi:hypothetical protein
MIGSSHTLDVRVDEVLQLRERVNQPIIDLGVVDLCLDDAVLRTSMGLNRLSQRKPTALNESSGCISTHSLP